MTRKPIKVVNIVGARPNFMKMAPIVEEMKRANFIQILVHTGQHYDYKMSELFFDELKLPKPHIDLAVGSGSHAAQTGEIMKRVEPILIKENPDTVLVVGDVNSTLACALTACKLGIPVAHVEAGLRSFDRSMPEEINRVLTDAIADYLFTTEESAVINLKREGISDEKIFFVGNTMIDTLLKYKNKAEVTPVLLNGIDIKKQSYGVLTLHRPSNVENKKNLKNILYALKEISKKIPIIFPVHPRTLRQIEKIGLTGFFSDITSGVNTGRKKAPTALSNGVYTIEPLGYLQFLSLMIGARIVFTDSGGMQEETTILGVPCITLRDNTERPITVSIGTNIVTGTDRDKIVQEAEKRLDGFKNSGQIPHLWDGKAAKRIVKVLTAHSAHLNILKKNRVKG